MIVNYFDNKDLADLTPEQAERVSIVVEDSLFSNLYSVLFPMYIKKFTKVDRKYKRKMKMFKHLTSVQLLTVLEVDKRFWLLKEGETENDKEPPYNEAILTLRTLTEQCSPNKKIMVMENAFKRMHAAINKFWDAAHALSSVDELFPTVLYLVIRARVPNLHEHCALVGDFLKQEKKNRRNWNDDKYP